MDISYMLDGLHARQYFNGRNGIDVSEASIDPLSSAPMAY